jgi:hypothetical protein
MSVATFSPLTASEASVTGPRQAMPGKGGSLKEIGRKARAMRLSRMRGSSQRLA